MTGQVNPLYMQQPELFQLRAIVTKVGVSDINKKRCRWIQLNETIFHPKGGGQLSDIGTINGIPVVYAHKEVFDKNHIDQFEIMHCFPDDALFDFKEGDEVYLTINDSQRQLYSRMHTAGHLLAATTNELFPFFIPSHGNHDPNDGYVRFKINSNFSINKEELVDQIQPALTRKITEDLPVLVTTTPAGIRAIQIGESIMACGGTHVSRLQMIGNIVIKDVSHNKKEQTLTIKYGF